MMEDNNSRKNSLGENKNATYAMCLSVVCDIVDEAEMEHTFMKGHLSPVQTEKSPPDEFNSFEPCPGRSAQCDFKAWLFDIIGQTILVTTDKAETKRALIHMKADLLTALDEVNKRLDD